MLLVPHYIAPSAIHGLGVFASQYVRKGAKIWEFNPAVDIVIPLSELKNLPLHVAKMIEMRAEFYPEEAHFILGADGDSYMNHSSDPNLQNSGREGYAARDIDIGDEITCDYNSTKTISFDGKS